MIASRGRRRGRCRVGPVGRASPRNRCCGEARAGRGAARRRAARDRGRRARARGASRAGSRPARPRSGRPTSRALAGARAMRESYGRLFEPPLIDGRPNPRHLEKDAYLALGRTAAVRVAAANGAPGAEVTFPDAGTIAPVRVRAAVVRRIELGGEEVRMRAQAEAELAPPGGAGPAGFASGGGYDGPLAYRQGKPMRPDVAQAFDRMAAAARGDGIALVITQRLPQRRRAGRPVRAPPRSEVGRAAGRVAASQRHRARSRAALRVRLARRQRRPLPLPRALRVGALASRLRAEPALHAARRRQRRRRRGERAAGVRARSLRARAQPRGAALERVRDAAGGAALCGERVQPVRRELGRRPGHRAVHAREPPAASASTTRSTRRRRSTPRRT